MIPTTNSAKGVSILTVFMRHVPAKLIMAGEAAIPRQAFAFHSRLDDDNQGSPLLLATIL